MRGDGPQRIEATYASRAYFYPWQAMDPTSGAPRDGAFHWEA
jgi:hypothetical protein